MKKVGLPFGLTEEREQELLQQFKTGILDGAEEFMNAYLGYGCKIARGIASGSKKLSDWDDIESETYLTLIKIPRELMVRSPKRPPVTSLKKYVRTRVTTRVRMFIRGNHLVRTPWTSLWKGKQCLQQKTSPEGLQPDNVMYLYTDPVLAILHSLQDHRKDIEPLRKELLSFAKNGFETFMLKRIFQGFRDCEIAKEIDIDKGKVSRLKAEFVKRLRDDPEFEYMLQLVRETT